MLKPQAAGSELQVVSWVVAAYSLVRLFAKELAIPRQLEKIIQADGRWTDGDLAKANFEKDKCLGFS